MTTDETTRRTFGSLKQFGDVWWLRYRVDGKERWESLRTTSLKQAEKKAAVIEDRVGRGDYQAADARRVTFKDLERMIRTDYEKRHLKSLPRLDTALTHLRETFGTMRALAIATTRIDEYEVERLAGGAARATLNYELATLRRMFRLAVKAKRVPSAPSIVIHDPENARTGFIERNDFEALVDELPDYLRPPMWFGFYTGWRVASEILPLTWSRVDRSTGVIRLEVHTTKNGDGRTLPYSALPELAAIIEAQRAATTALEKATGEIIPFVFHRDGQPIKSYKNAWQRATDRAARGGSTEPLAAIVRPQLVGRIVHDLRRGAVRNLEQAGVPRSVAMKITGHKTESIFKRYAITSGADLRDGLAKLGTQTAPPSPQDAPESTKGTPGGPQPLRAIK